MGVSLGFMGEVQRNVRVRDESFPLLRCWCCEGNTNAWVLALGSSGENWQKS